MQQVRYQAASSEYTDAFRTTATAKNVFLILLVLSLLAQIGAFVAVEFVGVLDPIYARGIDQAPAGDANTPLDANSSDAASGSGATQVDTSEQETDLSRATIWSESLNWVLPATRFFTFVLAVLLVATLAMSVNLSLLDRLGGVAGFIAAFYWAIVLAVMVFPWQKALSGSLLCGATFSYAQLIEWAQRVRPAWSGQDATLPARILYFGRFIAYPALCVMVALVLQLRFARGYGDMGAVKGGSSREVPLDEV